MKPGDSIISWSQQTESLRRGTFIEDADDDIVIRPAFRFVYERDTTKYTRSYASEGILWIRGSDLKSPEAEALLVAFHLTYRSKP